jgi:flagella basal body P-ring formation protein FlgA
LQQYSRQGHRPVGNSSVAGGEDWSEMPMNTGLTPIDRDAPSACKPPVIVGNLTSDTAARREFDGCVDARPVRRRGAFVLAALVAAFVSSVGCTPAAAADAVHPIDEIESTAALYISERVNAARSGTSVHSTPLDSRLRLARCDQPLQAFLRSGTRIGARTTVGVRCDGASPWTVYVPVDLVTSKAVLTPKRSLPKGHVLSAADLKMDERDVSRMLGGYFSDPDRLVGQRLTQSIPAGRVITPSMVAATAVIRRGQSVTLVVRDAGLSISMKGKALADGALDQRIRVENSHSGRVVEGIVRSAEHVEVLVATAADFFAPNPKASAQLADIPHSNNDR